MQTTLNAIRLHSPCSSGWNKLLKTLNKTKADDEPVDFRTILESNGLDDAIWCLRTLDCKEVRLFAVFCARQVQHLLTDERSLNAIDVAEKFAYGEATEDELRKAYVAADAAVDTAHSAAYVAHSAAHAAAYAAAYLAAYAAHAADSAAYAADSTDELAKKEQEKEFIRLFC